jgi:hypothetical protein
VVLMVLCLRHLVDVFAARWPVIPRCSREVVCEREIVPLLLGLGESIVD